MALQNKQDSTDQPLIQWSSSVWLSDVDDTLIDTANISTTASDGIRSVFEEVVGSGKAAEVQADFNKLFALMMAGYRVQDEDDWQDIEGGEDAFNDLVAYFEDHQRQVVIEHGHVKKWSREVFIKRAAELASVEVSPELVHKAADAYWDTLTEQTELFPDALELSNDIAKRGRPLFLVTSSDARLKMQADGQFLYDPAYSEALKRRRIEQLADKGLQFKAISIGDPEDKPHLDFFSKAIKVAESHLDVPLDTRNAIMLGDSFGGDLQTPKETLGFGMVVLRDDSIESVHVNDVSQVSLGKLTDLESFLY